jgi:hypothetical protein
LPTVFGQRGERRADLSLVNLDAEDDTFHLIEITRKTGDRKGVWGDCTPRPVRQTRLANRVGQKTSRSGERP